MFQPAKGLGGPGAVALRACCRTHAAAPAALGRMRVELDVLLSQRAPPPASCRAAHPKQPARH